MSDTQSNRFSPRFQVIGSHYSPKSMEERVLQFWEDKAIFIRSVEDRSSGDRFVFYEGPPTANGKPGIHHVEARAFKDLIPRYQTMRGKRVERKAGWDTHGLPVELQVEKRLGISGKPQIENLVPGDTRASIAQFNALCKESVWQYKDEWERLTKRMGYWVDLEHPYITYERDYIESVWWILKQLWDKRLLYEDFKVVPYCPRCGTALSSHEVAQGYEQTTDRSVYIKFAVVDQPNTSLLAWTTTPWTLPGNVALAVGRDISYGRYKIDDHEFILADERVKDVLGDDAIRISDVSTDELTSLAYEPLFAVPSLLSHESYRVYLADFVTTTEGTGIVHTAVMYGEDDFSHGSSLNLPKHHTVDPEGKFTAEVSDFSGQFVKDEATEQALIDYLREGGALFKEVPFSHTYPFCWRCQTPLIYYAKQSWFIRMSSLRDELLASNATIRWVPEHMRDGRFGEWLREVKDWALSRDRYWGTPLPVWRCSECSDKVCVGSLSELTALSGKVLDDLHKPFIDDVSWACDQSGCQGTMERYPEVIDVWFDSGSMPLAQWHYPFDAESRNRVDEAWNYPANYIAEAIDQTRGWFYTLLAVATALGRPAPFTSVVSVGFVLDKEGKKMSKSRGNVIDPWTVLDTDGADALRFYMYSVNRADDAKKVDPADITLVFRKTFLILWNTYGFFAQQMGSLNVGVLDRPTVLTHVLDRWLLARTDELTQTVSSALDELDAFRAARALQAFVTELSTWYLKHSRNRTDESFLTTFGWALQTLSLLMAPFAPFFAEFVWQHLRTNEESLSVHLADWPVSQPVESSILADMRIAQQYVELGLAARVKVGLKIRQPLGGAVLSGSILRPHLAALVQSAVNVKELRFVAADSLSVTLDTTLTDELRAEGLVREIARIAQELRKAAGLNRTQSARLLIGGEHELWPLIEPYLGAIEKQTMTVVERSQHVSFQPRAVGTLTISLEIE